MSATALVPTDTAFYARPVLAVAPDLVGCILRHGHVAGRIVETEAYHHSEPASHGYGGLTARTRVLFGPPGHAYVYRSYGIHALVNAVCEPEGVGAGVLLRALDPLEGIETMRARRRVERLEDLCSGPGKLSQALGVALDANGSRLGDEIEVLPPPPGSSPPVLVTGGRVGITRAVDLPWRFCDASSRSVSRPWPSAMRRYAGRRRTP